MVTPERIRPATLDDLTAINDIYNFYVRTSTVTFDLEPWTMEERIAWRHHHAFAGRSTLRVSGRSDSEESSESMSSAIGERFPVLVAEVSGQVIGWCSLSPLRAKPGYRFTAEDSIYIKDGWQRRGIGKALLGRLLEEARRLDYHTVVALIGDSANEASIVLHQSLGFRLIGTEREVGYKFDRWLDVVQMQWFA